MTSKQQDTKQQNTKQQDTEHQMNDTIAVLYGGDSAEREVSLNSGRAIAKGLQQAGYQVLLFDPSEQPLSDLVKQGIKQVFIALHGRGGEDGCIQGALQYLGITYTGSGVLGSALSMDKIRCKQIFQALKLPTADFVIAKQASFAQLNLNDVLSKLGGKVMVKPANEGSSIGMAIAETESALNKALEQAFVYDHEVLVEAWIDGAEYTVAILGQQALPAIHMQTPREFYDYDAKYIAGTTQYHCPCNLSDQDEANLQALAMQAFVATGAAGWGRVDFMRTQQGQWQLLEVNTSPGMTETSLVPKAALVHGLSFSELVDKIVKISLEQGQA